jgi:hypothetical protein
VRHQRVMDARGGNFWRRGRKRAHEELDVLRERQAARQDSTIPCGWYRWGCNFVSCRGQWVPLVSTADVKAEGPTI